jgi:hypothetical protein
MKSNLFLVTIKSRSNTREMLHVKAYSILEVTDKVYTYINANSTPGVEHDIIEEIKLIGKILV